jgi:hypothetical protein
MRSFLVFFLLLAVLATRSNARRWGMSQKVSSSSNKSINRVQVVDDQKTKGTKAITATGTQVFSSASAPERFSGF